MLSVVGDGTFWLSLFKNQLASFASQRKGLRMPKRTSIKKDLNQTAFSVVQAVTQSSPETTKNPAAVALGRLGGLKGGKARAKSLSAEKRKLIAQKAARSRWKK